MADDLNPGSITHWIAELKAGDGDAAAAIWRAYFGRVIALARRRLSGHRKRGGDEEDVAASVFESLCAGAAQGRFDQLTDRDDLWRLLFVITAQKSAGMIRWENRQKRGGGKVRGGSVFENPDDPDRPAGFDGRAGDGPTPELLAQADEEFERLLSRLGDESLEHVALRRMQGESNAEIAEQLQLSVSSVERKLRIIRDKWSREIVRPA